MRRIGQLSEPREKDRFLAYLAVHEFAVTVFEDDGAWSLWIEEENQIPAAREAFALFEADPEAQPFLDAEAEMERRRRQAPIMAKLADDNAGGGSQTQAASDGSPRGLGALIRLRRVQPFRIRRGYTVWIVLLSILGAILVEFNLTSPAGRWMAFCESPKTMHGFDTLQNVLQGELWRLVSPSFLYFDLRHLVFGAIFTYHFGIRIESLRGPFILGLLILGAASFSNFAQAVAPAEVAIDGLAGTAEFGGMSGVVFGLFGFIWAQSMRNPHDPLRVDTITIVVMIAWQTICIASPEWGFANVGHLAGMFYGIVAGSVYAPRLSRVTE